MNTIEIKKSKFYKLSDLLKENKTNEIKIDNNIIAIVFDDIWIDINYILWENSSIEIYIYNANENKNTITVSQKENNSKLKIKALLTSIKKLETNIYSEISSSNSKSDIEIVSLLKSNSTIDLDAYIKINSWLSKVEASLKQENIFIWEKAKVRWIPGLLVSSNDVKASHSMKAEKINLEKIFYLRSRWIDKKKAISMIIESYIVNTFKCISMIDQDLYNYIINNIIDDITS